MATPAQIASYSNKLTVMSHPELIDHLVSVGRQLATSDLGSDAWESACTMSRMAKAELLRRLNAS